MNKDKKLLIRRAESIFPSSNFGFKSVLTFSENGSFGESGEAFESVVLGGSDCRIVDSAAGNL